MSKLSVKNHDRDVAGYHYIYPVISRRSGGLSIGINFNTNNACNWRCVYCQVPDLSIGGAPELDYDLLATELSTFLQDVLHGSFYQRYEIEPQRQLIKDIAISGNGEPTSVKGFTEAISVITQVVENAMIVEPFQYVLITNGSLIHHPDVQAGLHLFNQYNGQVWFKLDVATDKGRETINHSALSLVRQTQNLISSAKLCTTWVQSCMLNYTAMPGVGLVSENEQAAYLRLLENIMQQASLQGVMLYSLARPSLQPEAEGISRVNSEQINSFAARIRQLGLKVKVTL